MNTSEFLNALRARPDLPLAFSTASGSVPAGYHLTEIKRVTHDTVDCGNVPHQWTENQFELWTPSAPEPDCRPMLARKFLSIVDEVRKSLAIDGTVEAFIFGRIAGGADQLHRIKSIETGKESITVRLEPVSASCKAADREAGATGSAGGCCGTTDAAPEAVAGAKAGCCQTSGRREAEVSSSSGGCCGTAKTPPEASAKWSAVCCIASKRTVPSDSDVFGYRKTGTKWFTEFESHGIRFSF